MSGQAKRSRVRAAIRHREQVARLIALATIPDVEDLHCSACGGAGNDSGVRYSFDQLALNPNHVTVTLPDRGAPWTITTDARGLSPESGSVTVATNPSGETYTIPAGVEVSLGYTAELREPDPCELCGGSGRGLDVAVRAILGGQRFDVALARAYAERLIAEGKRAAETWEVYLDWCREHGWIRNNCTVCVDGLGRSRNRSVRCACAGLTCGQRRAWADGPGQGKRPRMDGDAMIRAGQRLLAALEGQPSECRRCDGAGWHWGDKIGDHVTDTRYSCDACNRTGHNLAGVLPEIERSASLRRRFRDVQDHGRLGSEWPRWMLDAGANSGTAHQWWKLPTRVYARGEHRAHESDDMVQAIRRSTDRPSIVNGESLSLWAPVSMLWNGGRQTYEERRARLPRWNRGERADGSGWTIDFAPLVELDVSRAAEDAMWEWARQMGIVTGTRLDQLGLHAQLVRAIGEDDAAFRTRITAATVHTT